MQPNRLLLAVGLLVLGGCATPSEPAAAAAVQLFDGKSLGGWKTVSKDPTLLPVWKVTDGVIACQGSPFGYARTLAAYRDYTLHIEWRWPDKPGNSGIFLHVTGEDKIWPACLEMQLKSGQTGMIIGSGGARFAELTDPKKHNVPRQGADSEKPVGEWNSADIVCRGDTVRLTINGVLQNEITGATLSSGCIALQAEGGAIEFRHVALQSLAL
jgi:hypothetical protein